MKYTAICLVIFALVLATFSACDDNASEIGTSLVNDQVEIIVDSSFTITGQSNAISAIRPKTSYQMLGRIDLPCYGSISSSVVAQFLPSTALDTAEFSAADVDSITLVMRYNNGSFIGDSIVPMGIKAYTLTKQLPNQIASDFDPTGYYNPDAPLASSIYNATCMGDDSIAALNYRDIRLKLPTELGRYLFQKFVDNPDTYANGQIFARDVFPGLYIENYFGSGRLTVVTSTYITLHMRHIGWNDEDEKLDTLDAVHQYYMVTPEVINNNNLTINLAKSIQQNIDQGENMIIAPAGYDVDITFPTRQIIASLQNHNGLAAMNSLTFSIPADSLINDQGVTAPPYLLMVLKKDKDKFFAENMLTDNKTSFYASYDTGSQKYDFFAMRGYINEMLKKETIEDDDCVFSLVPVQVNFESTTSTSYYYNSSQEVETEILPYLFTPVAATLKPDKAKIKLTYSLQTQK